MTLETHQKKIEATSEIIQKRFIEYRDLTETIRKKLEAYFFDKSRTDKLTEIARGEQVGVNFNELEPKMRKCLVDAQSLAGKACNYNSFVLALDECIIHSGLPFQLQDAACYTFNPEKSYTPFAQAFMGQFAAALSVYRTCLGISELYYGLFYNDAIQNQDYFDYLESVNALKTEFDEGVTPCQELFSRATPLRQQGNSLLSTTMVHSGLEAFENQFNDSSKRLKDLIVYGESYLEKIYVDFPNDAKMWLIHSRSWHELLADLADHIYPKSKIISWFTESKLAFSKSHSQMLQSEIDEFGKTMLEETPELRIALAESSLTTLQNTRVKLRAKMAQEKISIINEAPKSTFFQNPSHASNNFYRSGAEALRSFAPLLPMGNSPSGKIPGCS
ncbi:coiled-coil protein [Legionella quinlivanii]|uniref:Coiled-coil protein n=1 Tax=Legionella quinlivanii TaxID=45073 RepID=A0A0W0XPI9_9GAMM|nr:hypothetical protein [Legionella quinlivanii]KTD46583.1 coiled-coil protein [Legionella quinlivanii]MCW8451523.1 hypothetical protein [Legionella quinlivanii]SEG08731.1 hypothetical protein SAMN02746093_01820 [Legionella quinlivanii DSM 21216]STY10272.1 coiled-coil protein [Legionella quinlivanii]